LSRSAEACSYAVSQRSIRVAPARTRFMSEEIEVNRRVDGLRVVGEGVNRGLWARTKRDLHAPLAVRNQHEKDGYARDPVWYFRD